MADNEAGISPNAPMQDLIGQMNYQAAQSAAGLNLTKQMNNTMSAVNMNVGRVAAAINRVDATLLQMSNFQKATNMNIGKVAKSIDQTNKILTDMLRSSNNGKSSYDSIENKLESKDISNNIQSMTDSLANIDASLKQMLTGAKNTTGSASSSSMSGTVASGIGYALGAGAGMLKNGAGALYGLAGRNANKILGVAGRGVGIGIADYGLGYAGIGQNNIDYSQDQKNWDRMSFMNKTESSIARGMEYVGSWVAPNITNEATAARIRDETEYFRQQEVEKRKAVGAFPAVPLGTNKSRTSSSGPYGIVNNGSSSAAGDPQTAMAGGLVLGSWGTQDMLNNQQARIEQQAKDMTNGDMLYEAQDIVYKATNIRFEASSIQFSGGGQGGTGVSNGGVPGYGSYDTSGNVDYDGRHGGKPQYSTGSSGANNPVGAARLSPSQKAVIDKLEKNGSYTPTASEVTALAGLSPDQLKSMGISRKEGRGPHGGTSYSYDKNSKPQDFLPPQARALLDTISGPGLEGADYNRIVGHGGTFSDFSHHPNKVGLVTQNGKSTAAGRYQILNSTWKGLQKQYPELKDFSPHSQDVAAWYLARDDYKARTGGRSLEADLQSNDPQVIATVGRVLSKTWTSLPGGIEQGSGASRFVENYQKNLAKGYQGQGGSLADRVGNAVPDQSSASSTGKGSSTQFKNQNLADGVSADLVKVAELAAKKNPELFGIPSAADAKKFDVEGIAPGKRTLEQQKEFLKKGWSKTMKSKHLDGNALDLWPVNPKTGELDPNYQEGYAKIATAMKQAAAELGVPLEWGGDWKKFKDRPHWQTSAHNGVYSASKSGVNNPQDYTMSVGGGMGFQGFGEQHGKSWSIAATSEPSDEQMSELNNWHMTTYPKLRGHDEQVLPIEETSKNSAAIARTESLRREQARIKDRKEKEVKRREDRADQLSHNKDAPGPKNPTVTRKELDSVVGRHHDWYKQWSATI